jgi:hypothetical protein
MKKITNIKLMCSSWRKIILIIKLTLLSLILFNGSIFGQNNLHRVEQEKVLLLSYGNNSDIYNESIFISGFEKVNSYPCTDTLSIQFGIPKTNRQNLKILNDPGIIQEKINSEPKKEYLLSDNNSYPYGTESKIAYSIKTPGIVRLIVYNSSGKEIGTLVNEFQSTGDYEVHFSADIPDMTGRSSGISYYTIEVNTFADTQKALLIK